MTCVTHQYGGFDSQAGNENNENNHPVYDCNYLQTPLLRWGAAGGHLDQPSTTDGARRKPQTRRPGRTASNNKRHFVVHNYHDHGHEQEETSYLSDPSIGSSSTFPAKLHDVLERAAANGMDDIISWQPHGRCFIIRKPKEFVEKIMPRYFRQTKLTSFQRQLNLYGFQRITKGQDSKGYYHEFFLRGKKFLCKHIVRTKIKGTKFKAASSPEQEPNFYALPPLTPDQKLKKQAVISTTTPVTPPPQRVTPVIGSPHSTGAPFVPLKFDRISSFGPYVSPPTIATTMTTTRINAPATSAGIVPPQQQQPACPPQAKATSPKTSDDTFDRLVDMVCDKDDYEQAADFLSYWDAGTENLSKST